MKRDKKGKYTKGNLLDRFSNLINKISFNIFKLLLCLIVGLVYSLYTVLARVYKTASMINGKLPQIVRMILFYSIIAFMILMFTSKSNEIHFVGFETIKEKEVVTYVTIKDDTCKFDLISCKIYMVGQAYGLSEEESLIAVAISKHETGNYKYISKNNFGGNMKFENGISQLINFDSQEQGINYFISNLRNNYIELGLKTIDKIQPKYAPLYTANDPKGLNQFWISGVTKYLNNLKELMK